jgi:hypothetical protein
MNEAAWLKGDSLHLMLEHVRAKHSAARTRVGRRRLRLFCCACVRRIWHLIDEPGRALIEAAERAADELLSREEWRLREQEAFERWQEAFERCRGNRSALLFETHQAVWAAVAVMRATEMAFAAANCCALSLARAYQVECREKKREEDHGAFWRIYGEESVRQGGLLLDIFGNPFRPPAKRAFPAGVRGLARACYDGDASVNPILADALADLGEEGAAAHCREPLHVKGCHVIDWVLGKA